MQDRRPTMYPQSAMRSVAVEIEMLIEAKFNRLKGSIETGHDLITEQISGAYYKADKCHERVTRVEEELAHLREQIQVFLAHQSTAGPAHQAKRGKLDRITSLIAEVRETAPKVSEMLLALAAVIAAVTFWLAPTPEKSPPAPLPSAASPFDR